MDDAAQAREPFRFAGYLGAFTSSLLFSISLLCLKLLPVESSTREMVKASMIRGVFMMLFFGISVIYRKHSFKISKGEYLVNFLRATAGAISVLLVYVSTEFISLGESGALFYSSPVWTCIISFFVLKEPFKISLLIGLPTSLLGIILVGHPDLLIDMGEVETEVILTGVNHTLPDLSQLNGAAEDYFQHRLTGIIIALIGSLFLSVVIVVLKFRKNTPIDTCSFYLGVTMLFMAAGLQCITGFGALPVTLYEWALHGGIGLSNCMAQYLFQWSLLFMPAGYYSVLSGLDIALGFVMGAIFLGEVVLWTSIAGSVLISLVVVILMLDDYLEETCKSLFCTKKQSPIKK